MGLIEINVLLEKELIKKTKNAPKCNECGREMEISPFVTDEAVWECPHCGVGLRGKEKNHVIKEGGIEKYRLSQMDEPSDNPLIQAAKEGNLEKIKALLGDSSAKIPMHSRM